MIELFKKRVREIVKNLGTRRGIIETIKSPLGFFVLALLIIEIFIAVCLVKSNLEPRHNFIVILIGIFLFIVIIAIVTVFAWKKPHNLTYNGYAHLLDTGKIPWGTDSEEIAYQELEKLKSEEKK